MNKPPARPKIERLSFRNYRALQQVELRDLKPLTVLVGPNGSGKSTILDVLSFVSDCFRVGLQQAWSDRGGGQELKTRGQNGPIEINIAYREQPGGELIAYFLEIEEENGKPVINNETVTVKPRRAGHPETILKHTKVAGEDAGGLVTRGAASLGVQTVTLVGADLLAVNVFGQFLDSPVLAGLRRFIHDWQRVDFSEVKLRAEQARSAYERLNETGDNITNLIHHMGMHDPERLEQIFQMLVRDVPRVEKAVAEEMADGRLLLRIKDVPFRDPILARFASNGTLKILAYLVLFHQPNPPSFIGVEEPENLLHPRLMYRLAEEFRNASGLSQLLVTTHSPYFVDALHADEVRVLYRDERGYTRVQRASDIEHVKEFMEDGGMLGDLWMEGRLHVGDPHTNSGMPVRRAKS